MSKVLVTEQSLQDIADAIRGKNGSQTTYLPSEMAVAISNIENSYTSQDEGKVVSNGALVAQTAHAKVTQNGIIDTTLNNSVEIDVSGGGGGNDYPTLDFLYGSVFPSGYEQQNFVQSIEIKYGAAPSDLSTDETTFVNNYATSAPGTSFQTINLTKDILKLSESDFLDLLSSLGAYEYSGNVYGNTSMISDCNLVLLCDASQSSGARTVTLTDSLNNYSGILIQGIYRNTRNSNYNTTMFYHKPQLNISYWSGMKDRNTIYDCYVEFTDNVTANLSGSSYSQCMIYGIV